MENKKENFKRISENRVNKILVLLAQMRNLSNSSYYEYTDEDVEKIFKAINDQSKKTKDALLRRKNKGKDRFEL